jgi:pullulanase
LCLVAAVCAVVLPSCTKLERAEREVEKAEHPSPPPAAPKAAPLAWPPEAKGRVLATAEITPPEGYAGREMLAGLKLNGRIVARGTATVPGSGNATLELRAMDPDFVLREAEYILWLNINNDSLRSSSPSFGDMFAMGSWQPKAAPHVIRVVNPALWKLKKISDPRNLITIHYHRYDGDYDNPGLWTWDATPGSNQQATEVFEAGSDDFGLVFQIDRAAYGVGRPSERIGILPRLGGDWKGKDGVDKFWTPALGDNVYVIGALDALVAERPDTTPPVTAAYIDAVDRVTVQLGRPVDEIVSDAVAITNDLGASSSVAAVRVVTKPGETRSYTIEVTPASPLDVENHDYDVGVRGFTGTVRAAARGVPDRRDRMVDLGVELGAVYSPESTTFRVFAPSAKAMRVVLYSKATGEVGRRIVAMKPGKEGVWEAVVDGNLMGKFYSLGVSESGTGWKDEATDIWATNTVDSGRRARITDLAETNPSDWEKARTGPKVASPVDAVIYEMHVRDFTIAANSGAKKKGLYAGFAEEGTRLAGNPLIKTGLDHLVEFGVTHVQLLPVQDFSNDESRRSYNWGYITNNFNSPEGMYASDINDDSRIRELKLLIKALHERGIGVIMDVVYNHTGENAAFNTFAPRYYYRMLPSGAFSNGSGCGNEFRSESPMGRKFILDSVKYWAREYGVDGYRFDLMALIDLTTMKQVERDLRALNPNIMVYGEPWAAADSPLEEPTNKQTIRGTPLGAFNDDFRNALKGLPDGGGTGFIQDGSSVDVIKRGIEGSWRIWTDGPAQSINYMTCHDNLVLYDKLKESMRGASEELIKETMKLGYLVLFTSQGVPFIHGGEEFARTKQGNSNSYEAPDSINEVDWSLKKKNADLYEYTRGLIALRKQHPLFRLRTREDVERRLNFDESVNSGTIMFTLDGSEIEGETFKKVCVLLNSANKGHAEFKLPPGKWQVLYDEKGAVSSSRTESGEVKVRWKSGLILAQL